MAPYFSFMIAWLRSISRVEDEEGVGAMDNLTAVAAESLVQRTAVSSK